MKARESTQAAFWPMSTRLEGNVTHFYLDVRGLPTIGIGIWVSTVAEALKLPLVHKSDELPATPEEIAYDWRAVKLNQSLREKGHWPFARLTKLKLTEKGNERVFLAKAAEFEKIFLKGFYNFEEYPADAQLCILSMAWAKGPGFYKNFPLFTKHCLRKNWPGALSECKMREWYEIKDLKTGELVRKTNHGLVKRNELNYLLLKAAQATVTDALDPNVIHGFTR